MDEKSFRFVFNGVELVSPDKYFVDHYGNRFMKFSDVAGNTFKISRDDLIIDMSTGNCVQRHKVINVQKL